MTETTRIHNAILFATEKHAGQLRKGTRLPYIVHPFAVGMFLQGIQAESDVVIAGLLHDTLEDTHTTLEEIVQEFGAEVGRIVQQVTLTDKSKVLDRIATYSLNDALVKSADVVCNVNDIYRDYLEIGDKVFERFSNSKEYTLNHYAEVAKALHSITGLIELQYTLTKIEYML